MKKPTNHLSTLFLDRLQKIFTSENYQKYLSYLSERSMTCFRINTLKTTIDDVSTQLSSAGFHLTPITWCKEAFCVPTEEKRELTQTSAAREGLLYIQNASSLLPSLILAPQPNEEILDLAAAPGGKTLHMAALMENKGRLAAVEAVKNRFFRLKANIKLAHASVVQAYFKDGTTVWRNVFERFDRVLLDAPCSSEARINPQDPASFAFWGPKKIKEMTNKQKKLLFSAIQCLKPLGILVYSTCSFAPEENECIVQTMLDKFPESLEILPIDIPITNFQKGLTQWEGQEFSNTMSRSLRVIPTNTMSGFFICKLRKL